MRAQPSMARCIEARSVRSPCTPSAPSRRRAPARSSSRRTRARTLWPLASSIAVRLHRRLRSRGLGCHVWVSSSVQRSGLVWHPDGGPDLAEFTRDLSPGRADILTDVHLTEQAERHNAVGVSGMRGKAPYSGIGLGGEWQDLPSLPEVCGAEHVPLFTRRGLSTPGEQHARIIGLDHHAAGIGQRPFLLDAQSLPGIAEIAAGKHFARCAGIEALGLRRRNRHRVNVRVVQTRLEVRPSVPTVEAAEDAVNFNPCPDNPMIVGVHDDAGDEGSANRALAGEVYSQFLPVQSPISRAIDPGGTRTGEENIRIDRVDGQRPDRWQSPIGADALPPRPSIVAHEQARIATCDNGMRVCGMGDQRLDAAIERERGAMPYPRLSGIRAVPYAPANRSKTYTVVRCHTLPPSPR